MKGNSIMFKSIIIVLFMSFILTATVSSLAPSVTTQQVFSNPDGKSMYIVTVRSSQPLVFTYSPEVHVVGLEPINGNAYSNGIYTTKITIVTPRCNATITATADASTYPIFSSVCRDNLYWTYLPIIPAQ